MKFQLVLIIGLISNYCLAQFKVNDTLFFLRNKTDSFYHKIFIEQNKKSFFYSLVSDFSFSQFDSANYERSLSYLKENKIRSNKQRFFNFPTEFTMVETYKGKQYVYSPNDFYSHHKIKITDSILIDFTGEGPEATAIKKIKKINTNYYLFYLASESYKNRLLSFKFLNKSKGIVIVRDKRFDHNGKKIFELYYLMVDVKKMRQLPLIVNICDTQKQFELEFDMVNYRAMFEQLH